MFVLVAFHKYPLLHNYILSSQVELGRILAEMAST